MPLFYGTDGAETTEAGGKPSLEGITPKQVLAVVQLHDGVLQHSVARRLDRAGWTISEDQYAELMHAAQVSEGAERIIKSMNRQSAPQLLTRSQQPETALRCRTRPLPLARCRQQVTARGPSYLRRSWIS